MVLVQMMMMIVLLSLLLFFVFVVLLFLLHPKDDEHIFSRFRWQSIALHSLSFSLPGLHVYYEFFFHFLSSSRSWRQRQIGRRTRSKSRRRYWSVLAHNRIYQVHSISLFHSNKLPNNSFFSRSLSVLVSPSRSTVAFLFQSNLSTRSLKLQERGRKKQQKKKKTRYRTTK